MIPVGTLTGSQTSIVRGLYGYDTEGLWWEQPEAIVYRGRRKIDGLGVLLKLLRDPGSTDWGKDWLERDYRIAQGLAAPCAVKPVAFEQTDVGPALIYADQAARPLEELATKAPLDVETVLTIGASIGEAVAALHKERLVHCNLNPTTIWLNDAGDSVLISDFGCARRLSEEQGEGIAPCDELIDLKYMSPEQTGRLQTIIDQRSDLYSLGIILFRLLTGKVPFDGDPREIIDGHVARQPTVPAELRDAVPVGLVRVLLKALAKSPETRYLSASGLIADLLECRSLWRSTGAIAEFEPGRHDAKAVLRMSRRLYGRDRDLAMLAEKAKAVQRGRPAWLLINGAPGVGKSALIGQLEELVHHQNGRFVTGKFDQYKRNVPYLFLVQVFQQLIGQILTGSKEQIESWRALILAALGNSGQVVIDVVPEVERLTGPQPQVPALPPVQARNRFSRVFTNLLQAFAPPEQQLCLVMDDLQWADGASLELLAHVLTNPDASNILFVGAYRDNEVDQTHPLATTIGELRQANVDVQILHLDDLKEPDVLQLVRDTFNASMAEARDLGHVLHANTGGNALYVTQLLHFLCDEGLIAFDQGSGKWTWDLPRIQQQTLTQDLLDLLNRRLEGLHQDTRSILATAACLGSSFEVEKLAIAAGRPLSEVLHSMLMTVEEGPLLALKSAAASGLDPPSDRRQVNTFRFLHDRIQQAAFDCIPEEAKKEFRLHIGRRLMGELTADDELIPQPDVLSNLNYAWELITDDEQRQHIARLNLVAGRRARQALAYQDALGYVSVGLDLLGKNAWQHCYDLAFELHSEAFECEYLTANFERADQLFRILIANARSKLDKTMIYRTKILLDTSEERYEEAVKVGIAALRLFKVRYVRNPSRLHLLVQLMLARYRMRGREPQDLLRAKGLDDPEKIAALRTLVALVPPASWLNPDLLMYTALKVVNCSLRDGITSLSATGFAYYGMVLVAAMDDYKRGYDFGRVAVELAERSRDASVICKVLWLVGLINVWRDPFDEMFPLYDRAQRIALESGEHQYANFATLSMMYGRFGRGTNLSEILRVYERHWPLIMHSKDVVSMEMATSLRHWALALQGKTTAPTSLNDGTYDENAAELHHRSSGNLLLLFFQYLFRLQLACLFGCENALTLSDKSQEVIRSAFGFSQLADHYLYRGLATAVALSRADGKSTSHRHTLRHCLARLHLFATNSPHNFLQHELLLKAEAARVKGRFAEALKLYNRAIEQAEAEGFTHLVGLANERAAQCCLASDERRMAGWYLACSRAAYDKWGASAKVAWLDREYAGLLPAADGKPNGTAAATARPISHQGERFDIAAALQASHIIASGENPERVLTHLMQVIRVQAGAETAQLLALEGGKLRLEASAAAGSGDVALFPSTSADTVLSSFSPAIVNYVLHTGEDLLLLEATADPRFAQCPYIAGRHPKSVLCSGIRHQGELLGVIYLEHSQIVGAFSGQKLEWLRLLSTEVGLTVWTGRLSRYREYVHKFAPSSVSKQIDANPISPDLDAKDSMSRSCLPILPATRACLS